MGPESSLTVAFFLFFCCFAPANRNAATKMQCFLFVLMRLPVVRQPCREIDPQWLLLQNYDAPWRTISALGTPTPSQHSKLHKWTDNANLLVLSLHQIWLQHRLKILRKSRSNHGLQLTSIMWRAVISVTWPAIAATRADSGSKRRSRCWRQDNQNEGSLIIETSQITNCLN